MCKTPQPSTRIIISITRIQKKHLMSKIKTKPNLWIKRIRLQRRILLQQIRPSIRPLLTHIKIKKIQHLSVITWRHNKILTMPLPTLSKIKEDFKIVTKETQIQIKIMNSRYYHSLRNQKLNNKIINLQVSKVIIYRISSHEGKFISIIFIDLIII